MHRTLPVPNFWPTQLRWVLVYWQRHLTCVFSSWFVLSDGNWFAIGLVLKLYKAALGNCYESEDWGPVEFRIMAKHFERQGKSPYVYHSVCFLNLSMVLTWLLDLVYIVRMMLCFDFLVCHVLIEMVVWIQNQVSDEFVVCKCSNTWLTFFLKASSMEVARGRRWWIIKQLRFSAVYLILLLQSPTLSSLSLPPRKIRICLGVLSMAYTRTNVINTL